MLGKSRLLYVGWVTAMIAWQSSLYVLYVCVCIALTLYTCTYA